MAIRRITRANSLVFFALLSSACGTSTTTINQVTPDHDAGVTGGKTSNGGAPGGSAPGGSSSSGGKSSTAGAGGLSSSGGASAIGGTSSIGGTTSGVAGSQTTGGTSGIAGSQTAGGSGTTTGGNSGAGGTSNTIAGASPTGGTTGTVTTQFTGGSTAGGAPTGGKTSTGGSSATGGTSANGVGGKSTTGGVPPTGGPPTGGVATGGKPPTGGAATGGVATGGMPPTGGAATGGAPPTGGSSSINQFVSGPCVTSPDLVSVEIFANGGNQHIYRRVVNGTNYGSWASIAGLNASLLDIRSDLDCSSNTTTVNIAASGSNPVGSYMHAIGFGTLYNQFVQELSPATVSPAGVSVATANANSGNRYDLAGVASGAPNWVDIISGNAPAAFSINNVNQLTSTPDIAIQDALNSSHFHLVAFDTSATLALFEYVISASPSSWWPPVNLAAPATKTYNFSPTICTESNYSSGNFTRHIVAVAGNKLWYSNSGSGWPAAYSAWEQISTSDVASAPDCTVTSDGTVHVVALSNAGTIVDAHGKTGSWTLTDLGGY